MKEYCQGCHRKHDDFNWKGWYEKDKRQVVYICSQFFKPSSIEVIPQRIKDERERYGADQIQSHRQGEFSREYAETYPDRTREMIEAGVVTRQEVKKSKYVWRNDIKNTDKARKIDADLI